MGGDVDYLPIVSFAMVDQPATFMDGPQTSFDAPKEAFVHLSPTIRWEQDPNLSKFMSHSWNFSLRALVCTMPPTSALRQSIQMPC